MSAKQLLKKINEAIKDKLFGEASYLLDKLFEVEPDNYAGCLFKGYIAFHNPESTDPSEAQKWYKKATAIDKEKEPAWQGLVEVFEKYNHVDGLLEAWEQLYEIYHKKQDWNKSLEYLKKILDKCEETKQQKVFAEWGLKFFNDTRLHGVAASNGLARESILKKVLDIGQSLLQENIQKEVQKRRFRLGAPPLAQIEDEVSVDVYATSKISDLYEKYVAEFKESPNYKDVVNSYLKFLTIRIKCVSEKQQIFNRIYQLVGSIDDLDVSTDIMEWIFDRSNCLRIEDYIHDMIISRKGLHTDFSLALEILRNKDHEKEYDSLAESAFLYPRIVSLFITTKIKKDYNLGLKECSQIRKLLTSRSQTEGIFLDRTELLVKAYEAECLIEGGEGSEEFTRGRRYLENVLTAYKNSKVQVTDNYIYIGITRSYEKEKDFENAVSFWETNCKDLPEYLSHLGYLFFKSGALDKAEHSLNESIRKHTVENNGSAVIASMDYYYLGRVKWDQSSENRTNKEICFKHFATSLSLNKNNSMALLYLGFYYKLAGDLARARKCFEKSYFLDQNYENAVEYANLLLKDGLLDEVISIYQSLINNSSANLVNSTEWSEVWFNLGKTQFLLKKYGDAIFSIQTGLRKSETCEWWELLGDAYHKQGRHVSALKAYGKATQLTDKRQKLLFKLGRVKLDLGLFKESAILLEDALKSCESESLSSICNFYLARCFFEMAKSLWVENGNYAKSVDSAQKALGIFRSLSEHAVLKRPALKGLANCQCFLMNVKKSNFEDLNLKSFSAFDRSIFCTYRYIKSKDQNDLVHAIQYLLNANGNVHKLWNNLGVLFLLLSLRSNEEKHKAMAQHCFIQSLENNVGWTNLGLLYFACNDPLAHECFDQATIVNPDDSIAWFMKGFIDLASDPNSDVAENLLSHAVLLSNFTNPEIDYVYSKVLLLRNKNLSTSYHALRKVVELNELDGINDPKTVSLFCLVLERFGSYKVAIDILKSLPIKERYMSFTLARCLLQNGDVSEAVVEFEKLVQVENSIDLVYGLCLALYAAEDYDRAKSIAEGILDFNSNSTKHLRIMHLYSLILINMYMIRQDDAFYSKAGEVLMKCIELDKQYLPALLSLMAIGIVSDDSDLVEMTIPYIASIPLSDLTRKDTLLETYRLISDYYCYSKQDVEKSLEFLQKRLFMSPSVQAHKEFTSLMLRTVYGNSNSVYSKKESLFKDIHSNPTKQDSYALLYFNYRKEVFKSPEQSKSALEIMQALVQSVEALSEHLHALLKLDLAFVLHILGTKQLTQDVVLQSVQYLDVLITEYETKQEFASYLMCCYMLLLETDSSAYIHQICEGSLAKYPLLRAYFTKFIENEQESMSILLQAFHETVKKREAVHNSEGFFGEYLRKLAFSFAVSMIFLQDGSATSDTRECLNKCLAMSGNESKEFAIGRFLQAIEAIEFDKTPNAIKKAVKILNTVQDSCHIREDFIEHYLKQTASQ